MLLNQEIKNKVGINLKPEYYQAILSNKFPNIEWVEIHSENYFGGSIHNHYLEKITEFLPLSLHSVGVNLGSHHGLNPDHLKKLKWLVDKYNPVLISEHISWGGINHQMVQDLLPMPLNKETMAIFQKNIMQMQDFLSRQILIENVSTYLEYKNSTYSEYEFLNELAFKTDCGILLDVNNIFINSYNHNFDPYRYIDQIDQSLVKEIHLAGHVENNIAGKMVKIDTHSRSVSDEVLTLYEYTLNRFGKIATIIEWDNDLPTIDTLYAEVMKAKYIITSTMDKEYI